MLNQSSTANYAIALGVVWVVFAFFAGIILVMSRQNELVREALSLSPVSQQGYRGAEQIPPAPKSINTAQTSVTVEGTEGDDVRASVTVLPKK